MVLSDLHPDEDYSVQVRCGAQENFWKWGNWSKPFSFKTSTTGKGFLRFHGDGSVVTWPTYWVSACLQVVLHGYVRKEMLRILCQTISKTDRLWTFKLFLVVTFLLLLFFPHLYSFIYLFWLLSVPDAPDVWVWMNRDNTGQVLWKVIAFLSLNCIVFDLDCRFRIDNCEYLKL